MFLFVNPKILLLFLIDCIIMIFYLDNHVPMRTVMILTVKRLNWFYFTKLLPPSLQCLIFDWYWLNFNLTLVIVHPLYCFPQTLLVSKWTTQSLLQLKWKIILYSSPVTVLLNWLLGYKMCHMSQFLLQHGKFPSSFWSSGFRFDQISLSRRGFGLRNATRGSFGSTDFSKCNFSMWRWADFNMCKITFSAG